MTTKKLNYHQAETLKNTKFRSLIVRNLADNNSVGASIGYAISDKLKARYVRFKKVFDPLNVAHFLTGNIGAAIAGKLMGRSQDDIRFFGDVRGHSQVRHTPGTSGYQPYQSLQQESNAVAPKKSSPLYTTVSGGQVQRLRMGDGVADVFAKIYSLMVVNHSKEVKDLEIERNFRKERDAERDKWNKELIDAILGKSNTKSNPTVAKEEPSKKKGGFFSSLLGGVFDFVKEMFVMVIGLAKTIAEIVAKGVGLIWAGVKALWVVLNPIKLLADTIKGAKWLMKLLGLFAGPATFPAVIFSMLFATGFLKALEEEQALQKNLRAAADKGDLDKINELLKKDKKDHDPAFGTPASLATPESSTEGIPEALLKESNTPASKAKYKEIVDIKDSAKGRRLVLDDLFKDAPLLTQAGRFDRSETSIDYLKRIKGLSDKEVDVIYGRKSYDNATYEKAHEDATLHDERRTDNMEAKQSSIGAAAAKVIESINSPLPSSQDERLQSLNKEYNDLARGGSKISVIDASQQMTIPTPAPPPALSSDSTVNVRNDETTFSKVSERNLRFN